MNKALTIAGSDPSGGAGIQADLKVFHAFGVYGLSVISSLTAQNSREVSGVMPVSGPFVKKQLVTVISGLEPDAIKTGMLYSESNVEIAAQIIRKYSLKNIVVDPVIVSSSGKRLALKNTPAAIRKKLLPLCTVITPNLHEASVLTGIRIKTEADMEKAAVRLKGYGPENVIITGGHLEKIAMDIFYDGDEFHYLRSRKIKGEYHGTGCTFSAAITALLALGHNAPDAAAMAKDFMNRMFRKAFFVRGGMRLFDIANE